MTDFTKIKVLACSFEFNFINNIIIFFASTVLCLTFQRGRAEMDYWTIDPPRPPESKLLTQRIRPKCV